MDIINLFFASLILILLLLSALFSGLESAIISINKTKINHLVAEGDLQAKKVVQLMNKIEMVISACLIGNNITIVGFSVVVGTFMNYHGISDRIVSLIIIISETTLFLFIGEIIPKAYFRSRANTMISLFLPFIFFILFIFKPFLLLIHKLNHKLVGKNKEKPSYILTREEVEHLFEMGNIKGIIDTDGSDMISDVFEFGDITAREVMVPTINIISIEIKKPLAQLAHLSKKNGFSRIPVYEERVDNLVGYVSVRSLLNAPKDSSITDILQKGIYVPLTKRISELYVEMKSLNIAIAFVVNEYGAVAGMISPEDIVEEIIGEIQTLEHPRNDLVIPLDDYTFLVDGMLNVDNINEIFGTEIKKNGFQTLGGFLAYRFGKIPSNGENLAMQHVHFTVSDASPTRVRKVNIKILDKKRKIDWKDF